jgi:hypothetical protein
MFGKKENKVNKLGRNTDLEDKISCISVFFFVFLIALWRTPERIFHGSLWAEDVPTFLKSAYEAQFASLIETYAGYFHILPRIIAYTQTWNSTPESAAHFYMWSSVVLTAISSAYTFNFAKRYSENPTLSALTALAPLYVAHSGEVFFNITNLQWILAPSLLALLVDLFTLQQRSRLLVFVKTFALFLLGLTGPFSLIFAPIALLMLTTNLQAIKKVSVLVPAAVFFTSVIAQGWVTLNSLSESSTLLTHPWIHRFLSDYLAQIFLSKSLTTKLDGTFFLWAIPTLLLISAITSGRKMFAPLILFAYSIGLWGLGVIRVNNPEVIMSPFGACARYYFLPAVFMAWGIILCIKNSPLTFKPIPSFLLSCMFLTGMTGFNAEKHDRWSVIKMENAVYEIVAPPGWRTIVNVKK